MSGPQLGFMNVGYARSALRAGRREAKFITESPPDTGILPLPLQPTVTELRMGPDMCQVLYMHSLI